MKAWVKTIITTTVTMVLTTTAVLTSSGVRIDMVQQIDAASSSGNATQGEGEGTRNLNKDETVYALLAEDGSVRSVYVVNHTRVPEDGTYVDYGYYERVESLTEDIQPWMEDDRILWDLKASYGDFYYQGVLSNNELPWIFDIQYTLDGNPVEAQDLAGKSGRVEIALSVSDNELVPPLFREQFAMQIQVPVNLDAASIISADGATQVITGQTNTLAYTVLPGTTGVFSLVMEARNFEMGSINIGISAVQYGDVMDMGNLGDGFAELSQGMDDWIGGAKSFKNGLTELASGVSESSAGLHDLSAGGKDLSKGIEILADGVRQFGASMSPITDGSMSIRSGLSQLAANGDSVLSGYQQLAMGIQAQLPNEAEKEQLRMLAQNAGDIGSPYAQAGALAQSMLDQIAGLEQLYQNLVTLNGGLSQYTGGVSELSLEYTGFDQGLEAVSHAAAQLGEGIAGIEDGSRQLTGGLDVLDEGMTELNENMNTLPGHVQELIDGGLGIKEGIDGASAAITGMLGQDGQDEEIKSFAAPEKGLADSVQFVIRTPAIFVPEEEKEAPEESTTQMSFWERLVALFM